MIKKINYRLLFALFLICCVIFSTCCCIYAITSVSELQTRTAQIPPQIEQIDTQINEAINSEENLEDYNRYTQLQGTPQGQDGDGYEE